MVPFNKWGICNLFSVSGMPAGGDVKLLSSRHFPDCHSIELKKGIAVSQDDVLIRLGQGEPYFLVCYLGSAGKRVAQGGRGWTMILLVVNKMLRNIS